MFEIVKGSSPRPKVHLKVLVGVVPIWLVLIGVFEWLMGGAEAVFRQQKSLVFGAMFFFLLDFWTAVVYRIWLRGDESFSSQGLASGAQKMGLWIVIGAGSTIWANSFPADPEGVRWFDPRWLAANIDLLAFLYMFGVDIISSVENVTGREIGKTGIGQFFRAVTGTFFPQAEEVLSDSEKS